MSPVPAGISSLCSAPVGSAASLIVGELRVEDGPQKHCAGLLEPVHRQCRDEAAGLHGQDRKRGLEAEIGDLAERRVDSIGFAVEQREAYAGRLSADSFLICPQGPVVG